MPADQYEYVIILLVMCAVLLAILARLDSPEPPLDTKHALNDLPEWYSFSEKSAAPRDAGSDRHNTTRKQK